MKNKLELNNENLDGDRYNIDLSVVNNMNDPESTSDKDNDNQNMFLLLDSKIKFEFIK